MGHYPISLYKAEKEISQVLTEYKVIYTSCSKLDCFLCLSEPKPICFKVGSSLMVERMQKHHFKSMQLCHRYKVSKRHTNGFGKNKQKNIYYL